VVEALKPAKLKTLEVDEAAKKVTVLVDEENLSLAIGRRGQNARLTQKLTGWEIDVKKEEEVAALGFEQKLAKASEALALTLEIEAAVAEQIVRGGFLTVEGIAEVELDDFVGRCPISMPPWWVRSMKSAGFTRPGPKLIFGKTFLHDQR